MAIQPNQEQEHVGTGEELESLLMVGLASTEISEEVFWDSVDAQTNAMLAAYEEDPH